MIRSVCLVTSSSGLVALLATACTSPEVEGAPPEVDRGGVSIQQLVTDNGWDMVAATPSMNAYDNYVSGTVTFSRSSGPTTRAAGACLLNQARGSDWQTIPCSTANDCSGVAIPAGGARYCVAPNATGSKTCWIRPGSASDYCTGSPALGGAPIGPGSYTTPTRSATFAGTYTAQRSWLLYGCFAGCSAISGSLSSTVDRSSKCYAEGHYWDGDATCWETAEEHCAAIGGWWANDTCYEDYEVYECETRSVSGTLCLYYQWYDQQCNCVI